MMTNAEKYLKDGTDIKEIANGINEAYLDCHEEEDLVDCVYRWFETKGKPTLTEDERVILRNIGEDCISLIRKNGEIYFHTEGHGIFPDLFKFIKERRRI